MSRARSVADLGNQNVLDLNASAGTLGVGAGITFENTGEAQFAGIITATGADFSGAVNVGGVLTYEDVTSVDSVGVITARNGIEVTGHTETDTLNVSGISTAGSLVIDGNVASTTQFSGFDGLRIHNNNGASFGVTADMYFTAGTSSNNRGAAIGVEYNSSTSGNDLYFATNGSAVTSNDTLSERLRIKSDGKIIVGDTDTPRNSKPLGTNATDSSITIEGTDLDSSVVSISRNVDSVNGPYIVLGKSRGTQVGSYTSIQSGDDMGVISFVGFSTDGNTNRSSSGAYIKATVDEMPFTEGGSHLPGKLSIYTGPDSDNAPYERLRIDSEGRATFLSDPGILIKTRTNTAGAGISFTDHRTGPEDQFGDLRFYHSNGDTPSDQFGSAFVLDASEASRAYPAAGYRGGMAFDVRATLLVEDALVVGYGTATNGREGLSGGNTRAPLYVATKGMSAFDSDAGTLTTALLRIEDFGSSDNLLHGIDIRNKNSGDIRILNEDVAASNTANMIFAVDTGDTDELAIRHKIYGGTSRSRDYNLRRELYTNIDDVSTGGDITAKSNRVCFIADSGENANDMHRIEFWEATTTTTKLANMAIRYDGGEHSDGSDGSLTIEGTPDTGDRDFLTLSRAGNLYLHRGQASIEKDSTSAVAPDTTTTTANKGANLELINKSGSTGSGCAITGVGLGTKGRYASIAFEDITSDNTGTGGEIVFSTSSSKTGALTERCRIRSNGIQMTSGDGISFTATGDGSASMTSELLDDYEEGTWTPTCMFNGSSTGVSYGQNNGGSYCRIGRMVYLHCRFHLTNNGSSTGSFTVGGLPYACGNHQTGNSSLESVSAGPGYVSGGAFDISTGGMMNHSPVPTATISNNTSVLTFRYHYYDGSTGSANVTNTHMPNTSEFVLDIVYQA